MNGKHINLRSIIRNRHLHLLKYEYLAGCYVLPGKRILREHYRIREADNEITISITWNHCVRHTGETCGERSSRRICTRSAMGQLLYVGTFVMWFGDWQQHLLLDGYFGWHLTWSLIDLSGEFYLYKRTKTRTLAVGKLRTWGTHVLIACERYSFGQLILSTWTGRWFKVSDPWNNLSLL